ncbi:hypothetical protein EYF80_055627 [Liparis tanakae]|uniref:Uncharacterized protein n=1 Tax=Liparis tanakae TaxID=230148 RepID=A0A4Z2EZC4_9TELE|nr:hypothetical protein EYF80_055627 [Liparis tanakae]
MRTALSVVLTCCPPAPLALVVSILRSLEFIVLFIPLAADIVSPLYRQMKASHANRISMDTLKSTEQANAAADSAVAGANEAAQAAVDGVENAAVASGFADLPKPEAEPTEQAP